MTVLETLKSYLISIGFGVDNTSFAQFNKSLSDVESKVTKLAETFNIKNKSITESFKNYGKLTGAASAYKKQIDEINKSIKEANELYKTQFDLYQAQKDNIIDLSKKQANSLEALNKQQEKAISLAKEKFNKAKENHIETSNIDESKSLTSVEKVLHKLNKEESFKNLQALKAETDNAISEINKKFTEKRKDIENKGIKDVVSSKSKEDIMQNELGDAKNRLNALKEQSDKAIKDLSEKAAMASTEAAATMTTAFVGATVLIISALDAMSIALVNNLANYDLEIQKFSRKMFVSQENGYGLKMAMDAMGAHSMGDLKDIAMIPELRDRFKQLRGVANENTPSADYEKTMKDMQEVQTQWMIMQMKTQIEMQKIGIVLFDNVVKPLEKLGLGKSLGGLGKALIDGFASLMTLLKPLTEILGFIAKLTLDMLTGITKLLTEITDFINGFLAGSGIKKAIDKIGNAVNNQYDKGMDNINGGDSSIKMTSSRQHYADLIKSIGHKMGATQKDITIALATAMDESGLQNLNHGDGTSKGLFQQTSGNGWGTEAQRMNPQHATQEFYKHLLSLKNRSSISIHQAAQMVQQSAFHNGSNYARFEKQALQLSQTNNITVHGSGNPHKDAQVISDHIIHHAKRLVSNRNNSPITA